MCASPSSKHTVTTTTSVGYMRKGLPRDLLRVETVCLSNDYSFVVNGDCMFITRSYTQKGIDLCYARICITEMCVAIALSVFFTMCRSLLISFN